jgi:prepilin-type N-terminal cleavage/methylation domain-containing protein
VRKASARQAAHGYVLRDRSRARARADSRRTGLTLVEVLMALAILGIGLFVLVAAASRCLAVARQAKHYEKARHLLARAQLENPLQLEEEIETGTKNGSFSGEPGYTWVRRVELVNEESGDEEEEFFLVTWSIHWSDRNKAAKEEVVTYLYAPEDKKGGSFERGGG